MPGTYGTSPDQSGRQESEKAVSVLAGSGGRMARHEKAAGLGVVFFFGFGVCSIFSVLVLHWS